MLSGKYRNGKMPENSRLKLFSNLARFSNDKCFKATDLYHDIAMKHDLSLTPNDVTCTFVSERPLQLVI